jgi:hypothetical protein
LARTMAVKLSLTTKRHQFPMDFSVRTLSLADACLLWFKFHYCNVHHGSRAIRIRWDSRVII